MGNSSRRFAAPRTGSMAGSRHGSRHSRQQNRSRSAGMIRLFRRSHMGKAGELASRDCFRFAGQTHGPFQYIYLSQCSRLIAKPFVAVAEGSPDGAALLEETRTASSSAGGCGEGGELASRDCFRSSPSLSSFIRPSEQISRGTVTGRPIRGRVCAFSYHPSRTSEHSSVGAAKRRESVRMFG